MLSRRLMLITLLVALPAVGFGLPIFYAQQGGAAVGAARSPNDPDRALFEAVGKGDAKAVEALLDSGANPNARGEQLRRPTVLMAAAAAGSVEVVRLLLARGADVAGTDDVGSNALMRAAEGGNREVLRVITEAGAPVGAANKFGDTPLILASKFGQLDAVRYLVERGSDINAEKRQVFDLAWFGKIKGDDESEPPFASGAEDVRRLLGAGDTRFVLRTSATATALIHGRFEVAAFLLEKGARPTFLNDETGGEALRFVARRGQPKLVQSLLGKGVDVDARSENGRTALMEAARSGQTAAVEELLRRGANVNARDAGGYTPFLLASRAGHERLASLLLKAGADPAATENEGATALMLAAEEGRAEVVGLLLSRGADRSARDKAGRTAAQRARNHGRTAIVAALGEGGSNGGTQERALWP